MIQRVTTKYEGVGKFVNGIEKMNVPDVAT